MLKMPGIAQIMGIMSGGPAALIPMAGEMVPHMATVLIGLQAATDGAAHAGALSNGFVRTVGLALASGADADPEHVGELIASIRTLIGKYETLVSLLETGTEGITLDSVQWAWGLLPATVPVDGALTDGR